MQTNTEQIDTEQPASQPAIDANALEAEVTASTGVESQPIGPAEGAAGADQGGPYSPMLSMVFMGIGAVALAYTFMRMIRKGRPPRPGEVDPAERVAAVRDRAASQGKGTLDGVMADATELSQRLAAQLDSKAERLEHLIAEADAKIASLEARGGAGAKEEPEDPRHAEVLAMSGRGMSSVEIARATGMPTGQVELIVALRKRA